MRGLLLLPLLLMTVLPTQDSATPQQESTVVVTAFKWFRARQVVEEIEHAGSSTAATLLRPEKNLERNTKVNEPAGVRDPRADTLEGRSEALEGIVQESRTSKSKPVDGFAYRARIRNTGTKVIDVVFWEYQSSDPADPSKVSRRQFLCSVNIKPKKEFELKAFSLLNPIDAISVDSLNKAESKFTEKVFVNRVEFTDGKIWQRKDWSFGEIKRGYDRAVGTTWGSEMCRGI